MNNNTPDLSGPAAGLFARYGVLTVSHKTAPVAVRERLAIPAGELTGFLAALKASDIADEHVVLSTCNRTEIYAAAGGRPPAAVLADLGRFLVANRNYPDPLVAVSRGFSGLTAVLHAFRVVSSLESLVLGETGIVGQFTEAYETARQAGTTAGYLNRLFQAAQAANKAVRSGTSIQEGNASVAGLAAQSAARALGRLDHALVLVLGAGETAETAARALKRHGAGRFIVSNRTLSRGEELARALGGTAAGFDSWPGLLAAADVVIAATASPRWLVTQPLLKAARAGSARPLVLLDLSVPRNVEPYCASLPGVTVLDVDGLETAVKQAALLREGQRPLAESIIAGKAGELCEQLERAERFRAAAKAGRPE